MPRRPADVRVIDWIFMRGIPRGECLEYPRQKERYPSIKVDGKAVKVHRYVFEFVNGPTDQNVLHHCDNTYCFLPEHLFSGTQKDNVDDMVSKGRHWLSGDLCARQLHELTEDNVYTQTVIRNGVSYETRSCKTCHSERTRERRASLGVEEVRRQAREYMRRHRARGVSRVTRVQ